MSWMSPNMEQKAKDYANCGDGTMTDDVIRQREEITDQYKALAGMKKMAAAYGYDISQPAKNAKEACQWLYFGYLAAIKTQNGAAMSVGRVSTFLDIYIQRDLDNGVITEKEAQELIDHMVMKFPESTRTWLSIFFVVRPHFARADRTSYWV